MKIFHDTKLFQKYCQGLKKRGTIGFVPTMGCLHEGHLSLIQTSTKSCDFTVVSIFVNPLQFGVNEDFSAYPRPWKEDLRLCRESGVEALLLPDEKTFYEADFSVKIEESTVSKDFCGKMRPGHFSGVMTVVAKLLHASLPDLLFLGQKDYQQCLVLKRLIRDLDFPVKVRICPTLREKSGLAMSSINKYLSPAEKENAAGIYKSLLKAKEKSLSLNHLYTKKNLTQIKNELEKGLKQIPGFTVQYADIVSAENLSPVNEKTKKAVALIAGFLGKTRLIDNILL